MFPEAPDLAAGPEPAELILAIQVYLRQDAQLRRSGQPRLADQPHWAETALWSYAGRAARRLLAWSQPAP
ncbi:MAG: hypothetical protein JNK29_20100 [Anaerolineales bacterium]|nr:hypothetical protein [Anaerolineales bacterium]